MVGIIRLYKTYNRMKDTYRFNITEFFDGKVWTGKLDPKGTFYRIHCCFFVYQTEKEFRSMFPESRFIERKEKYYYASDRWVGMNGGYHVILHSFQLFCNYEEAVRLHECMQNKKKQIGASYTIYVHVPKF